MAVANSTGNADSNGDIKIQENSEATIKWHQQLALATVQ